MRRLPGLGFWKLCGSGTGEGFTPAPNTAVYAILAVWRDAQTAREQVADSAIFGRYARRAAEVWTVFLTPLSSRGAWSGTRPFQTGWGDGLGDGSGDGLGDGTEGRAPIAVLTRATLRPRAAPAFWRRVPDISAVIGDDTEVLFKIGIGEVPLLHQVTFSIWPDTAAMARFARADGPHASAIRAVRDGKWFREELYARFRVLGDAGLWNGARPLEQTEVAA